MRNFIISIILFIFFFNISLLSQREINLTVPQVVPVTPEAAAVEKYASYPVSYATGIPNITIPLYEIRVGNLILPISLSYHSSGLKPKERSGWVGTGWTLNAEPSIMRSVRGIPDDVGSTGEIYGDQGYFFNIVSGNESRYPNDYLQYLLEGRFDEEPDLYSYKLAHGGGTCIPDSHAKFKSFPLDNNKVEMIPQTGIINIYDENGTHYIMGGEVIDGNYKYQERTESYITRWLCSEMKSSTTGASINFEYSDYNYNLNPFELNDYVVVEDEFINQWSEPRVTIRSNGSIRNYTINNKGELDDSGSSNIGYTAYNRYKGTHLKGKLLKKILFDNGNLTFSTDAYKNLKLITINDKSGNRIRWIEFFITKYNEDSELTKLDSVRISALNCQSRVYKFEYEDALGVPPMLTKAIDHWGYSNGSWRHQSTITTPQLNGISVNHVEVQSTLYTNISGRNRESNMHASKGILKKIINPEGIETTFTYELNRTDFNCDLDYCRNKPGNNCDCEHDSYPLLPIGGLRIKTIDEKDLKTNHTNYRYFKYIYHPPGETDNRYDRNGIGVPKRLPTTDDYCFTQKKAHQYDRNAIVYSRIRTWGSMPLSDITYNNGSAILYNLVEEHKWGTNSTDVMVTRYHYNTPKVSISHSSYGVLTHWYINQRDITVPFEMNNYSDYRWGTLKKQENFKNDILVSETEYTYASVVQFRWSQIRKPYKTREFVNSSSNSPLIDAKAIYSSKTWKPLTGIYLQKKDSTTYIYDNGEKISTLKYYDYHSNADHTYPTKIKTITSTNEILEEHFMYPEDQYYMDEEHYEELFGDLARHNIKNALLEYKQITENDTIYTRAKYEGVRPQIKKTKTSKSKNFYNRVRYLKYDYYGNPVEIWDYRGITTCYIWGYNSQYPIAKIENISYRDLLLSMRKNEEWIKAIGEKNQPDIEDMNIINGLRSNSARNVYTYTYRPLIGVNSVTDPRGFCIHYEYDNMGRLKECYFIDQDNKKNILEHNVYHMAGGIINNPVGDDGEPILPMIVNFAENYEGKIFTGPATFTVTVEGGSGVFEYEWSLWQNNPDGTFTQLGNPLKTTNPSVVLSPQKVTTSAKINQLRCKVKDLRTGKEKEITTWFYADV